MADNTSGQTEEEGKADQEADASSLTGGVSVPVPQVTPGVTPAPPAGPDALSPADGQAPSEFPSITALDTSDNPDDPKEALRLACVGACKQVFDPEIPVNIHELGLIYGVDIDEENNVKVTMTLTSPACPAAQELPLEVRGRVAVLPKVKDVEVDITFAPPWSPERMSEAARVQLGFDL
jgi:FeS assembly SUF system protein